jgi:hypothetical protein
MLCLPTLLLALLAGAVAAHDTRRRHHTRTAGLTRRYDDSRWTYYADGMCVHLSSILNVS